MTPANAAPKPVTLLSCWRDWSLQHADFIEYGFRRVRLADMPPLLSYSQGDSVVYGLFNGGPAWTICGKAWTPPDREIIASLLESAWPGVEFVLPE